MVELALRTPGVTAPRRRIGRDCQQPDTVAIRCWVAVAPTVAEAASSIPPHTRVDVIAAVVNGLGIRCSVQHERDGSGVHARLDAHVVGSASTFTYADSGIRMVHTARQARPAPADVLVAAVQGRRPGVLSQHGRQSVPQPG